jgi:hypothetical protein
MNKIWIKLYIYSTNVNKNEIQGSIKFYHGY